MPLAKVLNDGHWQPGIGDPTLMGWLIVAAYLLCLLACVQCWRRRWTLIEPDRLRRFGLFWLTLSIAMLTLAINKQLDLQSLLHVTGRNLAIDQGWFDDRRTFQRKFLVGIGAAGVLSVGVMFVVMRGLWGRVWLSAIGIAVIVSFIVMRAISFHGMDQLLKQRLLGNVRANHALEMAGIALVTAGAVINLLRLKSPSNPASHTAA